jgi:hypothetical protein
MGEIMIDCSFQVFDFAYILLHDCRYCNI